jgi:hypothetical protein
MGPDIAPIDTTAIRGASRLRMDEDIVPIDALAISNASDAWRADRAPTTEPYRISYRPHS